MPTTAAWLGTVALVVIALAFVAIAAFTVRMMMIAEKEMRELSEEVSRLRADLKPALDGVKQVAEMGSDLTRKVGTEVEQYVEASRRLRRGLERGVRRARVRLADLDALYEVVHGEVEHTALDVAARLRGLRRAGGMVRRVRRLLRRSAR